MHKSTGLHKSQKNIFDWEVFYTKFVPCQSISLLNIEMGGNDA